MATKNNKPKKQTTKNKKPQPSKTPINTAKILDKKGRGRPSAKNEDVKQIVKTVEKNEKKSVKENSKKESPKPVKEIVKVKETVPTKKNPEKPNAVIDKPKKQSTTTEPTEAPKVTTTEFKPLTLEDEIYGGEPAKEFTPFPQTTLVFETKSILEKYNLDIARLPQPIIDAVTDFITVLSEFLSNPAMVSLRESIMGKDKIAHILLKEWVEPREEKLNQLKVRIKQDEAAAFLASRGINMPTGLQTPIQPPAPQLIPAQPASSQGIFVQQGGNTATTNTPPPSLSQVVMPQMPYNQGNQSANHGFNAPQQDPKDKLRLHAKAIDEMIAKSFHVLRHGFLPPEQVKHLITVSEKSYKYEIVNEEGMSYLKITDALDNVYETEKFKTSL